MSGESLFIQALIILFLILLNGFFSMSEIAIISSRRSVIDNLAKDGSEAAKIVARMKNEPERFLATIQVGVTVVSTLASVIGGVAAVEALTPVYASVPYAPVAEASELFAISTVVILISYALLVLGELVPKTLALRYSEKIACFAARPIDVLSRGAGLFVKFLTASTTISLRFLGIKGAPEEVFAPRDEIKYYIKEGTAKGVFEETEAALLHGVFEFADTTVKEIMVPKPKISAIEAGTSYEDVLKFMAESGFSRYPVYKENINQIIGVLFNKDVFKEMECGKTLYIKDMIRPPYFVPSSIMISRLLREMQRRKVHMAMVVDDHGELDGIVTIEDILEEIVGEIEDEYDVEKGGLVERLKDGSMIVDASASLSDLTDVGMIFDEADMEEHATLAGLVLSRLQRIPGGGEFVAYKGYRFTVVDMDKNRIVKIKVEAVPKEHAQRKPGQR